MSVTGGLTGAQTSWPRWAANNVACGLAALVRPPPVKPRRIRRAYLRLLVGSLVMLVVIAAAMVFADASIAEDAKRAPALVIELFSFLTDFGKSGWFLWPTGILLAAIAALASPALAPLDRFLLATIAVRAGFLFTAIAVPGLFTTLVKRVIGRARPFVGEHADPFLYLPWVWRADHASLPSGHAATAFAAAVAVGLLWPALRLPMLAYAVVIAVSRVVLDAHYLSDVTVGAMVGVIGAVLVRDAFAARRLGFAIGSDGSVKALPGPSWRRLKRVARRLFAS